MKHSQLLELPSSPFTSTTKCVCGPVEGLRGATPTLLSSVSLLVPRNVSLVLSTAAAEVDGRTDSSSDSTQAPNHAFQSFTSSECDLSMLLASTLRVLVSCLAFPCFGIQVLGAKDTCMRARSVRKRRLMRSDERCTSFEKILFVGRGSGSIPSR